LCGNSKNYIVDDEKYNFQETFIFYYIMKAFLASLSKRAKLPKQYPQDAVLQRYTCLFTVCIAGILARIQERRMSGLLATQAGCVVYMPFIQYPEGYCLGSLALFESDAKKSFVMIIKKSIHAFFFIAPQTFS